MSHNGPLQIPLSHGKVALEITKCMNKKRSSMCSVSLFSSV